SLHRVQLLDGFAWAQRLHNGFQKLTLEDVQAILQNAATHDPFAPALAPILMAHAPQAQHDAIADWRAHGYPWRDADGDGVYDDAGYGVYLHVRQDLQDRVFRDELGGFTRAYDPDPETAGDPHAGDQGTNDNKDALLLQALDGQASHDWCDDIGTPQHESCADVIADAFASAGTIGPMPLWHSRFSPIGAGPAYEMPMTNRATYYHFHVGTDTSRSISTLPPGESGELTVPDLVDVIVNGGPGPEHMRDQLPLYNGFQGKPVPVTEEQAHAVSGEPTTLLVPVPPPVPAAP
ncbi:MAG: penicillin acylase family protein, partial [Halobacteriales archaeon]|nr:penicillin acylase family protein [Halobacteriales archaeon]